MAGGANKLYTPQLLSLAVSLAQYPMRGQLLFMGEARSRTCGSSLKLGFALDSSTAISDIGMTVSACAVGQAAAAIFAAGAQGKDANTVKNLRCELEHWLAGDGERPAWPGIEALEDARAHGGRYGAIMLPWNAALDALSKVPAAR